MSELWYLHRRRVVVLTGMLAALIVLLLAVALAVRATGGTTPGSPRRALAAPPPTSTPATTVTPSAPATDVKQWDAMPAVPAKTSAQFPAIPTADGDDPVSFVTAFATRLFTRDYYTSTREQLAQWAQYEDAPLMSPNYPQSDWSKVLADSLTDLTWDNATDTPIPADGPWLALHVQQARDTVSDVAVTLDQQWEQGLAHGYQSTDPLATVRDVTLTVDRTVVSSGRPRTTKYAVSLAVQLGTSPRGGYGVATTNNYVSKEID